MEDDQQKSPRMVLKNGRRNLILELIMALENNTLDWPLDDTETAYVVAMNQTVEKNFISREEWIKNMKLDPTYYTYQAKTIEGFQNHEALLLQLASTYLKRKITLLPFLKESEEITYTPENTPTPRSPRPAQPEQRIKVTRNKTVGRRFRIQAGVSRTKIVPAVPETKGTKTYYLLCCNEISKKNFYCSVFKSKN